MINEDPDAFARAVGAVRGGADAAELARGLLDRLEQGEQLGLLDGDMPFWPGLHSILNEGYNVRPLVHGEVSRLGVPGVRFVDGPRGCVSGNGTAFPVPMARGATWDVTLEERVGDVIGREVVVQGGNFFGGVCINLPRHPAWGRAQETYGDEPYHLGEFGAALVRGTQKHVMACVKHYALNSMENARFKVDVRISREDLHDMYLPHFKRVADEGVVGVMSAYNMVEGEWAGENAYLLTTVLRDYWGFQGIVVSDFVLGLRDAAKSLEAGLDLEEPYQQQRAVHLPGALAEGRIGWDLVERSGLRLLAAQLRHYAAKPDVDTKHEMVSKDARALAREVASRAMVLLRNEEVAGAAVLPIDPAKVQRLAVVGRLAEARNMGDHGSSDVRPPDFVTPLAGIRAAFPEAELLVATDDDPARAAEAAAQADYAIVIAGYNERDEGEYSSPESTMTPETAACYPPLPEGVSMDMGSNESFMAGSFGGDRAQLTLRAEDEAIIAAVSAANPRTVVAVVTAGAVIMEAWRDLPPAILIMWYAGMEGGHALADIITGKHNPSGRLPYSIPTSPDHLPWFDRDATEITYGRLHGQRLLDDLGVPAAFPHGFGLSYTRWSIDAASVQRINDEAITVTAAVKNAGDRDGIHVVQVYATSDAGPYAGQRMLVGFGCVNVAAGASASAQFEGSLLPLARWDEATATRKIPPLSTIRLEVGAFAGDPAAVACKLTELDA